MEVKDYMKLPYTRIVKEMNDESGHYFYGKILELDGCQSTGDTLEELYENLNVITYEIISFYKGTLVILTVLPAQYLMAILCDEHHDFPLG